MKKSAHSKAHKSSKSSARKSGSLSHQYVASRDHFFRTHPNAQWLLAIFIVITALFIGVAAWGQMQVYNDQWQSLAAGNPTTGY